MDSDAKCETDAEFCLLCGEKESDFKGIILPNKIEPYFVFNLKGELQLFINSDALVTELSECYHMTVERIRTRLYFVDIESEKWLFKSNRTDSIDVISSGILLWDDFGLPVSREQYTVSNIEKSALENHKSVEKIKRIVLQC